MRFTPFVIIFMLFSPVIADSPLWEVSKGDEHLYIGGTVHVLGYKDYPLPAAFEEVYNKSEVLVFETDLSRMETPEMKKLMTSKLVYQDGSKLKDHLKPETYKALEEFMAPMGMPVVTFEDYTPGMVSMMLSIMELRKIGIVGAGVDQFYNSKAKQDKKPIGKLETVEEQISFLEKMGEGDPDEFIIYTLNEIKNISVTFSTLKKAWRTGDEAALIKIALDPIKEFPETYQMLVVERNNAWVPQIEAMLKTKEIEMVLVGALHLVGEDSVLKQLEARGYTINNL